MMKEKTSAATKKKKERERGKIKPLISAGAWNRDPCEEQSIKALMKANLWMCSTRECNFGVNLLAVQFV